MKSGHPTEKCGAKTRQGKPCGKVAGWGTSHVGVGRCKLHGGASPNAEVAGAVQLARREAVVMGCPLDIDPHEALLECLRIAAGEVAYASSKVAALEKPTMMTMFGPQLDTWITVRQSAMDRVVTYSKIAIAAGIEERKVRLAEAEGAMLAEVIRLVLDDLGVSHRKELPGILRRRLEEASTGRLRLLQGGKAA